MATASICTQFNPSAETILEFLERFKVQCGDLLAKAGEDGLKKAAVLIKALPVNVITDLQRRIKPVLLSEANFDDIEAKLTSQYEVKEISNSGDDNFFKQKTSIEGVN